MSLTVDWNSFYGGSEAAYVRHRYPLPIDGYVCLRCSEGKPRHNCVELTCSCDCPELALQGVEDEPAIVDRSPFHGRRRDVDATEFMRMTIPQRHVGHAMKGASIRQFGYPRPQSVNPFYWRCALDLHDKLLHAIGTQVQRFSSRELTDIQKADAQLAIELRGLYAMANRLADEFTPPLKGSQQKWRVLRCVLGGQSDSYVIAGMTQLPVKHVSAWLSVLAGHGFIERVGEWRNKKVGHAHIMWRPVLEAIQHMKELQEYESNR